jgi:uncharacterized protein (DUF697 family)
MHVEEEVELLIQWLIHQLLTELLSVEYTRVQNFRRVVPFSVEVTGGQGAAVISINHTVHIEHRHKVKLEFLAKKLSYFFLLLCLWE